MQNLFTQGKLYVFIILFVYAGFSNELSSQNRGDDPDPQRENLLRLSESFYQQYLLQQERLERLATEEGIQLRQESEWGIIEIVEVNERGFFQAEMTNNLNAAITVGTNELWTGGSTSLDLMGDEYLLGIWDGGGARATHQEFNNGGFGARVTIMDGASLSNHATHVAGTMVAGGVQNSAQGMAPQAILRSYDWGNDLSEMASEAALGMTLSNHSYGRIRGFSSGQRVLGITCRSG